MALVPAKCTQCGANIEVDETKDAGICQYCGTAFITEKAINNYNINTKDIIINSNNVNVSQVDIEASIEAAKKLVENNLPYDAKSLLDDLAKQCPYDYRIWWELAKIEYKYYDTWFDEYNHYYMKAKALCTEEENEVIDSFVKKEQNRIFKEGESIINFCENPDLSKLDDVYVGGYKMQYEDGNLALYHYQYDSIFGSGFKKEFVSYLTSIEYEMRKCKMVGIITFEYDDTSSIFNLHEIYIIGVTDNKILIKNENTNQDEINKYNAPRRIGCYIATCVYGSYDCPQVWTLRRFRDYTLDETWYGRVFIKCYYAISPTLVKWFGGRKWFRTFWKSKLDKLVADLNDKGVEDTYYNDKY